MRNYFLLLSTLAFLVVGSPLNQFNPYSYAPTKGGCLDESAINYCLDCTTQEGTCLIDNELSKKCEDTIVKWKKKWNPQAEFSSEFAVFTYAECWDFWEVTIYDSFGNIIWQSNTPNEAWSGMTKDGYYEAGEYYLSIVGSTRGMTKTIDILDDFDLTL